MHSPKEIATWMKAGDYNSQVQLHQTEFRCRLVESWNIPLGARVLEIGCGQGDTTAVLASAVGPTGKILAVDLAESSYGAPVSLGDSAKSLVESPVGEQIEFLFQFDVMDRNNGLGPDAFDVIVLAHCTWYFASLEMLGAILDRVRPWAPRICLSEWDLQPEQPNQFGHFLAVLIQGQIEAHKASSIANVRTPYSREQLQLLLESTGWATEFESLVDTRELEDAGWEIGLCLSGSPKDLTEIDLAPKLRSLLTSQLDVLRRLSGSSEARALNAYSLSARRRE